MVQDARSVVQFKYASDEEVPASFETISNRMFLIDFEADRSPERVKAYAAMVVTAMARLCTSIRSTQAGE